MKMDRKPFNLPLSAKPTAALISLVDIGCGLVTRHAIPFIVIALLLTATLVGSAILALEEPSGDNEN